MGDDEIEIPQYLPKFIQTIFLELKDISKFNSYNMFLELYLKNLIYMLTLFLLFLIISYFMPV